MRDGQEDLIRKVKFNPLVDYDYETKPNYRNIERNIQDTSLMGTPFIEHFANGGKFISREERDHKNYTKLVTLATNRDLLLTLKPSTLKLFLWIMFKLEYRKDVVRITPEDLKAHLSRFAFNEAIAELEANAILKRIGEKRSKDYWDFNINPYYFFKGDAKQFYKDVIKLHPDYSQKSQVTIEQKTRQRKIQPVKSMND